MSALGINVTDRQAQTWHDQRPSHARKPRALVELQKTAADLWEKHAQEIERQLSYVNSDWAVVQELADAAAAAEKRYKTALANFYADPAPWWEAEDAAEDRLDQAILRRGG